MLIKRWLGRVERTVIFCCCKVREACCRFSFILASPIENRISDNVCVCVCDARVLCLGAQEPFCISHKWFNII